MDEDDSIIQWQQRCKLVKLCLGSSIDPLGEMKNEWGMIRCLSKTIDHLPGIGQRVSPSIVVRNMHGEGRFKYARQAAVMLHESRNTTKKIAYSPPPEAYFARNAKMLLHRRFVRMMNRRSPFSPVAPGAFPEPGKERKIQMIMRINKARHQEEARQISHYLVIAGNMAAHGMMRRKRFDPGSEKRERAVSRSYGRVCDAGVLQCHSSTGCLCQLCRD
uniref:Uncharacterized protein n=1 Tax=Paracidobacterium acidisoli TaxID=2303751 RepID=A0A372ILJ1_9BACT